MRKSEESTVEKLANTAVLTLISRASAPLMLVFVCWLVYTVDRMQIDIATLTTTVIGKVETLNAKIDSIDKREDKLENRWNSMDAFAGDVKQTKPKGGI